MRYFNALTAAAIVALSISGLVRALPFHWPVGAPIASGEVADRFEDHYDERFPLKTFGANFWATVELLAFGEGRPGVVVGREGWLYTDEEFEVHADAEDRVRAKLYAITSIRQALAHRGIELQVALIPAKARVYPEFLTDRRPPAERETLYQRVRGALIRQGIDVPDINGALNTCKRAEPVFLRTDTHWTPQGARCAAHKLAGIGPVYIQDGAVLGQSHQDLHGDLMRFLPLDPWFESFLPEPDQLTQLEPDVPSGAGNALLGDAAFPELVLIGTSYSADPRWGFARWLMQALEEDVLNLAKEGEGPMSPMRDFLRRPLEITPRKLIWEIPERYLPAPERTDPHDLRKAMHQFVVAHREAFGDVLNSEVSKKTKERL